MRINHNIQALNAYRNLSQTMSSTSKSLEKLSSGLRINKAADDAAGLAISEKMRSQIRGLDMAERNTLDAVSLIQTGEGALNEVHSILQRMRELSVQASNGTLAADDKTAIQSEITQLIDEVDRIAGKTQFNSQSLLNGTGGTAGTFTFQIGANSGETLDVKIGKMDTTTLGIKTVNVTTATGAQSAITALDNSIKMVSAERSNMGAYQNRLEHTTNNLQISSENLTSAESRIRDLDMAEEMTNFTRNNILNQAGQAMLAQANQLPQGILQLLK